MTFSFVYFSSYKQQIGRRPNMSTSNGMRNATNPGNMNGTETGPLNLTGKQMGSPWAHLPQGNKPGQPGGMGHHLQPHHQSPQTMPLSPPLTPLPPNSARFPPSMVLPPQSPFNPAANLHQLLLAAQCNPFLKTPVPGMSPFSMSPEMMENVQKILQLRQQQQLLNNDLQKSDKESDWVETDDENDASNKPVSVESSPLSNSNNNNNSNKSTFAERSNKSDEELKREEEMLEDEMKEEEDESSEDEKKQLDLAESLRAVFMKKFLEDFTNKSALQGAKEMVTNPPPQTNPISQPDGRPLFHAGEIPCKFNCGKMFSSVLDLFQHQDGNCTKSIMNNYDDSDRDNVVTDDDMLSDIGDQDSQDDLNTSGNNSSLGGGERKVRVRTLISDEQLVVLRAFYMLNPRPKREELEKVAAKIGHPFKVVKVWFQNSRARDRREGKPLVNQPGVLGHPSPSHTHSTASSAPPPSSFPAFPFLNNNFPQASNAALMTAAANLLQNTRGLPFINPNSPLFVGSNLEQPFDTSNKCNDVGEDHRGSSEEGDKGGSTIEQGSDDEFQASRALDSPQPLHNHLQHRPSSLTERSGNKHIERERKNALTSNSSQQPLDLSNKGLSSSSSSPSNSPLSASMKDTEDKEEKGEEVEEEEEEVILNLSSKGSNGGASSLNFSSSPITKTTHTSSIEDTNVMQVEKITTSRPLSQQPISSIPSEPNNQPSPQSTGKSPLLNLSAQGSGFTTTQTLSSTLLGLHAKQSSNLPMDVYRFGEEVYDTNHDTNVGKVGVSEKFDEEGNYSCEKCNKTFTKRSSLSRHKYEHSGKD